MTDVESKGLTLLRQPFPANQISKLPKATKAQNDALKADYKKGIRCKLCEGWHLPDVPHLDYVGHAALTDRLLSADPYWTWEPLAYEDGLPKFDKSGGLWIKLTICNQTRLGYGHAADSNFKEIGSREKEVIGDALRNAAMRFGAALDLWHKGDLHTHEEQPKESSKVRIDSETEYDDVKGEMISSESVLDTIKEHNLADYLITFGKHKGEKFKDFNVYELNSMLTWWKSQPKITGSAVELVKNLETYLKTFEVKK